MTGNGAVRTSCHLSLQSQTSLGLPGEAFSKTNNPSPSHCPPILPSVPTSLHSVVSGPQDAAGWMASPGFSCVIPGTVSYSLPTVPMNIADDLAKCDQGPTEFKMLSHPSMQPHSAASILDPSPPSFKKIYFM